MPVIDHMCRIADCSPTSRGAIGVSPAVITSNIIDSTSTLTTLNPIMDALFNLGRNKRLSQIAYNPETPARS
jgi:hypothetical protein